MATKKIVTNVTLHIPAKGHTPFEFDAFRTASAGSTPSTRSRPDRWSSSTPTRRTR